MLDEGSLGECNGSEKLNLIEMMKSFNYLVTNFLKLNSSQFLEFVQNLQQTEFYKIECRYNPKDSTLSSLRLSMQVPYGLVIDIGVNDFSLSLHQQLLIDQNSFRQIASNCPEASEILMEDNWARIRENSNPSGIEGNQYHLLQQLLFVQSNDDRETYMGQEATLGISRLDYEQNTHYFKCRLNAPLDMLSFNVEFCYEARKVSDELGDLCYRIGGFEVGEYY